MEMYTSAKIMDLVYKKAPANWRGLGVIKFRLDLTDAFSEFDNFER